MSSLAFVGEVQGYGSGDCSPCGGNRRQVVNTFNGLTGDITLAVAGGMTLSISGNTITLTGGGGTVDGIEMIPIGGNEVAVVFDTPFTYSPIILGAEVIKANPDDGDIWCVGIKSLTVAGFTAVLSGTALNANYAFHWEAREGVPPIISVGDFTFDSTLITFDSTLDTFDSL